MPHEMALETGSSREIGSSTQGLTGRISHVLSQETALSDSVESTFRSQFFTELLVSTFNLNGSGEG